MNKRRRLIDIYKDLPWYDRLELFLRAYLRSWPFVERRDPANDFHLIGDRRRSFLERFERLLGLESPDPAQTVRVHILALVATLQVILITLATASDHLENLLLIATFCGYAAGVLAIRQYRLERLPERSR